MKEVKEISEIDNIKNLYKLINNKDKFIKAISEEFDVEVNTIKTNWFAPSKYYIPKKYRVRERLIAIMQNWIRNQK